MPPGPASSPAPEQRGGPGLAPPARPCLTVPGGKEGWDQGWGEDGAVGAFGWIGAAACPRCGGQMCSAALSARGIQTGSPEQQSLPNRSIIIIICLVGSCCSKECMGPVIPVSADTALGNN